MIEDGVSAHPASPLIPTLHSPCFGTMPKGARPLAQPKSTDLHQHRALRAAATRGVHHTAATRRVHHTTATRSRYAAPKPSYVWIYVRTSHYRRVGETCGLLSVNEEFVILYRST